MFSNHELGAVYGEYLGNFCPYTYFTFNNYATANPFHNTLY